MTYGILKHKIMALLDVDMDDEITEGGAAAKIHAALPYTVDSVLRKTARYLKNNMRTKTLHFEKGSVGVQAYLPEEAFAVHEISKNGTVYGADRFTLMGKLLVFFENGEGEYDVTFYAFPENITEETEDETEIFIDDFTADTVAYGAAGELCHSLYPTDMTRYMRLMTEYDERIAAAAQRIGEGSLRNSFFGKRRGGFR